MDDALKLVLDSQLLSFDIVDRDRIGIGTAIFLAECGIECRVFGLKGINVVV
jgi:hypothetical protein